MIDLDPLFYPKSVAVIGASPQIVRDRAGFFNSLRECYTGNLYPVNPNHQEIHGIKCYPSISDIPEEVDYAYIMLPRERVLPILEDCVRAKTKFVLVFTSGFSELGEQDLEKRLVEIVRRGKTRIIGPNCIGVHCSESGVVYYAPLKQAEPGDVGYFSQSGGHALNFLIRGISLKIPFNKVISVGNQADLTNEDFLEYFANDERIKYICGYVEDIKDGKRFKELARYIILEKKKPLILWKGGRSEEGTRATQSHTGAMAIPTQVWDSVMNQLGIINPETQEEMGDILFALRFGFLPRGLRTCIAVAGGGSSVELTDAVSMNGLSVPTLSPEIQEKIARDISQVNTSTRNPIDLGMFGFDPNIFVNAATQSALDPNVDIVLVCQYPEMSRFMIKELWNESVRVMVKGLGTVKKPVVIVIPRIFQNNPELEGIRAGFVDKLIEGGIPSFPSAERAARVACKIYQYRQFMEKHGVSL
jgi:acyl-CoA synthetase (NDP forming)